MLPNAVVDLTEIARRAARGDLDALGEIERHRVAELRSLPPEAFEGSPESGPMCPTTQAERALASARSDLRRERLDERLRRGSATDDELFEAASYADVSPLYAIRRAAELGLRERPSKQDEDRIVARMRAGEAL